MNTYSILSYPAKQLPVSYQSLILSKWLRSLRFGNPMFKSIDSTAFYRQYQIYLEHILSKPDCIIRLAVLSDDPDVVLGFAVSREDVLDYIWTHKDNRKLGIATKLLPAGITSFTHITLTSMAIWRNNPKYEHLKFNPFA